MSYQHGKQAIDATLHSPYGCWTAVTRAGTYDGSASWHCVCECGLQKILTLRVLRAAAKCGTKCRHVRTTTVQTPLGARTVPVCSRCHELPRVTRGYCRSCESALNHERYLAKKERASTNVVP